VHQARQAALGQHDLALPLGALDPELALAQVHVRPLQRHHLPAAESRLASEEGYQERRAVDPPGRSDQPLRIHRSHGRLHIVGCARGEEPDGAERSLEHAPLTATLKRVFNTERMLLTVFVALPRSAALSFCTSSLVIASSSTRPGSNPRNAF
jgi:hypothetical protein